MRLLVVEDHEMLARVIRKSLETEGFVVDVLDSYEDAEAAIESVAYDACILDRGLPDGDGLDLVKILRKRNNSTPVLLLTARSQLDDRVDGLNSGGDDYVAKPVEMAELVARVRALIRRPNAAVDLVLRAGNLEFDTRTREVRVGEKPLTISRRETDVLEHLMRRRGRVVPKDLIEEKIYGFDADLTSNSVEVHISRLRKRLTEAEADVSINTIRGIGYTLGERT